MGDKEIEEKVTNFLRTGKYNDDSCLILDEVYSKDLGEFIHNFFVSNQRLPKPPVTD